MQAWPILRLSREFAIVRLELDLRRRRVAVAGATVVARRLLTVLEQRLTVLLRNCGSAAPSSSPITGCAMTFRPDTDKADGCVAHLWIYFCSDTDTDKVDGYIAHLRIYFC